MGRVGLHGRIAQLRPALVVEPLHQGRIAGEGLRRRHLLDTVALPQAAGAAKGRQPRFGRDAGAGQDDDQAGWPTKRHGATPAALGSANSPLERKLTPPKTGPWSRPLSP